MPPKRSRSEVDAAIVTLPYAALARGDDLSAQIEAAYGVDGLGILTVSGVPKLSEARNGLLPLAPAFAALPEETKGKYEVPSAFYAVGWSHGREKLQGRPDYAKGSYYANPLHNEPFSDAKTIETYPTFAAPNVWPDELPGLEPAFMRAGQLVHQVGCLVAAQCDKYVRSKCETYPSHMLEEILKSSRCHKARLLHYFPASEAAAPLDESEAFSSWCGWHNDHGSLTGLVPGMFFDHRDEAKSDKKAASNSEETPPRRSTRHTRAASAAPAPAKVSSGGAVAVPLAASPDPLAGLYVRGRRGQLVKVALPSDHLGFQIGETAQVHTGGWLQATPHAVRGCAVPGVSRSTFAVFMEPEWGAMMNAPKGIDPAATQSSGSAQYLPKGVPPLRSRWGSEDCPFTTCDFGAFSDVTVRAYH